MSLTVLETLMQKVLEAGKSMSPVPFTVSRFRSAKESFKSVSRKAVIGKIGHANYRISFEVDEHDNARLYYLTYDGKMLRVGIGDPTIDKIVGTLIDAYNDDPVSTKISYLKR